MDLGAVHAACREDDSETLQDLLSNCNTKQILNTNQELDGYKGLTFFHLCICYGSLECARVLLDLGAYINIRTKNGLYPTFFAAAYGKTFHFLNLKKESKSS